MSVSLQAVVALDTGGFKSGLDSLKSLVSTAAGAMSAAFGEAGQELLAMTKAFGGIGQSLAIFKQVVTTGSEVEAEIKRIAATSGQAGDAFKAFSQVADDQVRKTKATFSSVTEAMQILNEEGFNTASTMREVLAPSMQLASITGKSAGEAADMLTKMLAGFRMEGKQAGELLNLIAGSQINAGYSSEALAESLATVSVSCQNLGLRVSEAAAVLAAFDAAGYKGQEGAAAFNTALTKLIDTAESGKGAVGTALYGWIPAAEGVAGAIARMNAAGIDAQTVLEELGRRGGNQVAALMNVGADAIRGYEANLLKMADAATVASSISDTLKGHTKDLAGELERLKTALYAVTREGLIAMVDALRDAVKWITELVQKLTAGDIAGAWAQIAAAATSAWEAIKDGAKTALEFARAQVGALAETFKTMDWSGIWQATTSATITAWDAIRTKATGAAADIATFLKAQDWAAVWTTAKDGAVAAFNFWYGHVADVWGRIAAFLKGVDGVALWAAIKEGATRAWAEIADIAARIWPTVQEYARNAWAAIGEAARLAGDTIKSAFESINWSAVFDAIGQGFRNALEWALAFAESLANTAGLSRTFDALSSALVTLSVTFGYVWDAAKELFAALSDVDWADVAANAIDALDWTLSALIGTIDLALQGINNLVEIGLAVRDAWMDIPEPLRRVAEAIVGGAGLMIAVNLLSAQVVVLVDRLVALAVTGLANATTAITGMITGATQLSPALSGVGAAAGIAGAAFAGWELGKLIREIPGVSQALDDMCLQLGEYLGLISLEDHELAVQLQRHQNQRKELEAQREAQKKLNTTTDEYLTAASAYNHKATESAIAIQKVAIETKATTEALKENENATDATAASWLDFSEADQELNKMLNDTPAAFDEVAKAATKATEPMKAMAANLSKLDFKVAIDLPNITEAKVKVWAAFFGVMDSFKGSMVNFKLDIALPDMTEARVKVWEKFMAVMKTFQSSAVNFKLDIALPDMTEARVKVWTTFMTMMDKFKSAAVNFKLDIDLPKLSQTDVKNWEKFFAIFKGGDVSGLKIPEAPALGKSLASIDESLKALVQMKGVIWA